MEPSINLTTKAFELLLKDSKFVNDIKKSIEAIIKDGEIDIGDAGEVVSIIVSVIEHQPSIKMETNELGDLIRMIYDHYAEEYDLFKNSGMADQFGKIIDSSIRLVLLQPKAHKAVDAVLSKCGSLWNCCKL